MSAREIPRGVAEAQIAASDPATSVWVSANAGSGKTHVLAQRVIRLLLDGVDPGKILCLTFTKAAAATMANRVFGTLASWTALDDAELDEALAKIEGQPPSPELRRRARRLFAEALETPGGLKVQTIHAFCSALLHQFPFEADVPARFEVMEARAEAELVDRLRLTVLMEAAGAPETPLGRALRTAIVAAADITFADAVREAIGQRDLIEGWVARAGDVEATGAELSMALGIAPGDTIEAVEAAFFDSPHLPVSAWQGLAEVLSDGSANDRAHVERLAAAGAGREWFHVRHYASVFCSQDLEPRKNIVTKAIRDKHPDLFDRLVAEQARVCALLERRRAIVLRERTTALVTIVVAVLERYRIEKQRRALLDYDDLIEKTLALFDNTAAAWVHYKLDLGIDHVLIDEAQDTSPQQWEVIRKLTAEFTAGEGARTHVRRSIFAVGDEKQSIYSFQGAAPHRFDEMRRHFAGLHEAGGMTFQRVPLTTSFRSSPDILGAVDAVFARPEAYSGLTTEAVATVHEAVRASAPGLVEVWKLEEPGEKPEMEAWDAPFDAVSQDNPQARLAVRIADAVAGAIGRGMRAGDGPERRAVTAGDFLVLVRTRGPLFEAIIRSLKDKGVAVAGADRMVLTEHIAVMDLISLADALLLPEDDLALAEALKSPLFGFEDEHLFGIAHGRTGSLRDALRAQVPEVPLFGQASTLLDRLSLAARQQTPFAFYAGLLGAGGGRKRILARLGPQADDALDEFLSLALDYERSQPPSLQGFVAWLRAAQAEVKRDMDIVRDEVRVMTVHGAKGLEAPVVIIADTTTRPEGPRDPPLLPLAREGALRESSPFVWAGGKAGDVPAVAAARAAARQAAVDEHCRLLYVAMTRAEDRLIVCGARGRNRMPGGCWYELVHDALAPSARPTLGDNGETQAWRWRKAQAEAFDDDALGDTACASAGPALPSWILRDAPAPPQAVATLAPSQVQAAGARAWARHGGDPAAAQARRAARLRGILVHRLLASLPDIAEQRREEAARRVLARARDFDSDAAEAIVQAVLGLLAQPAFAPLFAPGSHSEVPIVGRIARRDGGTIAVSGQIDRLAVTDGAVLIADFKTDHAPSRRLQDVSTAYRGQLALYAALIRRIYPGRAVRAALIFTETAELIAVPEEALQAALAGLGVGAP